MVTAPEMGSSVPDVPFVIFDFVSFKQESILCLEIAMTAMFRLVLYVSNNPFNLGLANREGAVARLPLKRRQFGISLFDPNRGDSLLFLDPF